MTFETVTDPPLHAHFHAYPPVTTFGHLKGASAAKVTRPIQVTCIHYAWPGHWKHESAGRLIAEQACGAAGGLAGAGEGCYADQQGDLVVGGVRGAFKREELNVSGR